MKTWIGETITVFFVDTESLDNVTLDDVTDDGIIVNDEARDRFIPWSSILFAVRETYEL